MKLMGRHSDAPGGEAVRIQIEPAQEQCSPQVGSNEVQRIRAGSLKEGREEKSCQVG